MLTILETQIILLSLIPLVLIIEFFNHYISEVKATNSEKLPIWILTLILINLGISLEEHYLTKLNLQISYRVLGLSLYTWYIMLTVALIEESLKLIAIGVLIKKIGHQNIYHSVGIGFLFAAMENAWILYILPTFDLALDVTEARFTDGAPFIHISLAIYAYLLVRFFTWEKVERIRKIRYLFYLLFFIAAILLHALYNYYVVMALFGYVPNNSATYLSYGLLLSSLLLWYSFDNHLDNRDEEKIIKV